MMLVEVIIGLVLGAVFGLLLGGLSEANGEDAEAAEMPTGVRFSRTVAVASEVRK